MTPATLAAVRADITTLAVDAIVNAANSSLLGGEAWTARSTAPRAPDLLHECRLLGGCRTGDAKFTKGYRLPAAFIIHTVGPVWRGGEPWEPDQLASCYRRCMGIADAECFASIAFPSISTGIFGYPIEFAVAVAVATVREALAAGSTVTEVTFACFSEDDLAVYRAALDA